ncbi:zinc carboxypeptidase [Neolewinella xylanilytica]|uniref:Zinc carboxypeptidase n=1 Tax=Neolewinella xylanilytica TaxID=1514080 RepID=A0A2S6I5W6_9BACT|nr:M14 family zinc carboxypeptidase [Neolewinella xylanilytica]PPK86540.1 zinc carboxypeptidase [Neolewinella xylanilytica]
MTIALLPLRRITLIAFLLYSLCGCAQEQPSPTLSSFPEFPRAAVEATLASHRQEALTSRRFKQADLVPLIQDLPNTFRVDTAGTSVEGRPLWRVTWGEGETEVMLWSQMHGDEPTATAALFDLFSWLEGDGLDGIRDTINATLHLTFLPMLNPDGAEVYERRNALGIDLNRDAVHLTSPEAQLLKGERDRLNADWGFNLHDQSTYYSVGFPAERGAVLSILAPAFDWEKTMSPKREDAAQLIALMNDVWQQHIPGQVGRYNDDFEPRAFGDNLQKWGTRTVLIESGGYAGDPEKQEIRRLNLLGLIAGLHGIATGRYEQYFVEDYQAIPQNESNGMHEVILEDARVTLPEGEFVMDIGIRRNERTLPPRNRDYTTSAYVSDLGDLSTFGAFDRLSVNGRRVAAGKVYPGEHSLVQISQLDPRELYRQGYTAVRAQQALSGPPPTEALRVLGPKNYLGQSVAFGETVDLLVYGENDELTHAVVNGKLMAID